MFCKKCGNQLKDGVAFCNKCGTPVGAPMVAPAPAPVPVAAPAPTAAPTAAPAAQYQQPAPAYQQPVYQQPVYQQPAGNAPKPGLALGVDFVLMIAWLGMIAGCIMSAVSVFFDFFAVGRESGNLFETGIGAIVIVISVIGGIFALLRAGIPVIVTGILNFLIWGYFMVMFTILKTEAKGVSRRASRLLEYGSGFYLLIFGCIFMIACGVIVVYCKKRRKAAKKASM